jgi:hypothetical protein
MSLICAAYVPTAIVLSGDSRTTLTLQPPGAAIQTNVTISDAANKVFVLFDRFGVATCGAAIINNLPIAHYVEQFELQNKAQPPNTALEVAQRLLAYFRALNPIPDTRFIVAGYDNDVPWVQAVQVQPNHIARTNIDGNGQLQYGFYYAGDIAVAQRLLSQPAFNPLFNALNAQDAADFSRHIIRTTIDQLHFEPRFPTVGGPIDTVILSPARNALWLEQKKLLPR